MNRKNKKKIFILKAQLTSAIFLLVIALISGFFIFGPELSQIAEALTGNYSKSTGDNLDVADWNNLDDDFVAKSGDSMTGDLILSSNPSLDMHAATKQYADNKIMDETGNKLKIVCGETNPSDWIYPSAIGDPYAHVTVDTSAAGFSSDNVNYLISIYGNTQHYRIYGANSVYFPDRNSFEVNVFYTGTEPNFLEWDRAQEWGWRVSWCGIGA